MMNTATRKLEYQGQSSTNPIILLHYHDEITSVNFSNANEGSRHSLLMAVDRPTQLSRYISCEEWTDLIVRMDGLGRRTERNEGRAMELLIVLVPTGISLYVVEQWKDMKHQEGLGALVFAISTFLMEAALIGFVCKLVWDEIYEVYQKRMALYEIKIMCQAYSDIFRSRGFMVSLDDGFKDSGYHVYLVFQRVPDDRIMQKT